MPCGVGEADADGSAVGDAVADGEPVADGESLGVGEGDGEGLVADAAVHPLVTSIIPAMAQTAASRPRKTLPVMPYTTTPALQACNPEETVLLYAESQ
jgi:hypothetical protein